MTPLIDVLLVLLIIFMVITPLTPKGLEALVPQPPPPHQPETNTDRTVVVQVLLENGKTKLKINQEDVALENLAHAAYGHLQNARGTRDVRERRSGR